MKFSRPLERSVRKAPDNFRWSRKDFHFLIFKKRQCCALWPFLSPHLYLLNVILKICRYGVDTYIFKIYQDVQKDSNRSIVVGIGPLISFKYWSNISCLQTWWKDNVIPTTIENRVQFIIKMSLFCLIIVRLSEFCEFLSISLQISISLPCLKNIFH